MASNIKQKSPSRLANLSKGKKRILIAMSIVIFIVAATVGIYAARHFYTKIFGIRITPSKDFPITEVTYFLQNDPEWGEDTIGNSGSRMSNTGCLISCVASSMSELGVPITPGELNSALTANSGFENDILLWNKLKPVFYCIDYKYSRFFSSNTIDSILEEGLLPIVNVKYLDGNVTHWVMIVGAKNGEYMIYDPLHAGKEPIPLSTHGKIYAYRVLYFLGEK